MSRTRQSTTTRLFYGKYPYKAVLFSAWTGFVRNMDLKAFDKLIYEEKEDSSLSSSEKSVLRYQDKIGNLLSLLENYPKEEIRKRVEWKSLSLFFKDKTLLETLKNDFSKELIEFSQPASDDELDFLLDNRKIEIKPTLPYGCRFKVTLGYEKTAPQTARDNFVKLANSHPDDIRVTDRVLHLVQQNTAWWSNPYIYVKDKKYLMIVQMMLQQNIRSITEIKTQNEINQREPE